MDLGISKFLTDLAAHWSAYAIALSILGGVTMAILQTVKDLCLPGNGSSVTTWTTG